MKTKEFIEEARDLGLFVDENKNQSMIWIKTPYEDNYVGEVKTDEIGCRIFDESKRFPGISKLIYEYGMTPLEKREEEKKYWYRLRGVKEGSGYLNYSTDYLTYHFTNLLEVSGVTTKFTDSEVKNFPDDIKKILMLCEKIEVTP